MKLLTHNFLQCHIKGVKNAYPLKIESVKVDERDADFDPGWLGAQESCHTVRKCGLTHGGKQTLFVPMQTFLGPCTSG